MLKASFSDDEPDAIPAPSAEPTPAPEVPVPETPAETPVTTEVVTAPDPAPEAPKPVAKANEPEKPVVKPERTGRAKALKKLTTEATNGEDEASEPAEKPVVPAPAKAVEPPPELTDLNEGVEDTDKFTAEELTSAKPKTRKRIQDFLRERGENRPYVALGKSLMETCERVGMTTDQFGDWTNIGAGFLAGDPNALATLEKMVADAKGHQAPAAQPTVTADLEKFLDDKVSGYFMDPETAKELKAKLAAKPAAPAPSAPQPPRAMPIQHGQNAVQEKAFAEISRIEHEYETKYKSDWKKIRALAFEEIKKAGTNIDPTALPGRVRDKIELVIAQQRAKTAAPPPPPAPLKATTTAAAPAPKNGRERALKILTS